MRCGCPECETYMVHAESAGLGCVCPQCGARCGDCLGTNTVVSREAIAAMKRAAELEALADDRAWVQKPSQPS